MRRRLSGLHNTSILQMLLLKGRDTPPKPTSKKSLKFSKSRAKRASRSTQGKFKS